MDRVSTSLPKKAIASHVARGVNGRQVHNKILLALPSHERAAILSKLEFISLPTSTVLNEVGDP